jgi:NADH:ubiquinone oxidoreductase subunit 2 (subunit N)
MRHVNRMAFGPADGPSRAAAAPLSCKLTLALAAIPLLVVGIWIPSPLQTLLRAAAAAMGG